MPPYIGSFRVSYYACTQIQNRIHPHPYRGYKTVSTHIRSGAIVLSKLGVLLGRHALDIIAVGLVTGLLDQLPSRGEYKKVIRCDILP